MHPASDSAALIRTPDYRLRIFISSSLNELAQEREAARQAVLKLRLVPVMFESGARPHPAHQLYQAYLAQSHIFIGVYWQTYGWIAPAAVVSGLEEEYRLSAGKPRLIYIKEPAPNRDEALRSLLDRILAENSSSCKPFRDSEQLVDLVQNDLAVLLTERFEGPRSSAQAKGNSTSDRNSNLPIPRNRFVGRERELRLACQLLTRPESALITLTGPGGVGKSRLALHAALELGARFPDGTYLVPLETISEPELVLPAIARTLQISQSAGGQRLIDVLTQQLRSRQVLLLLDNFEHLLPAAPHIADLLERCPNLKMIVTSRAPLHLRAERQLPVPPLAIPARRGVLDLQPISQYPAIQLFVERARAVKPDFEVTSDNAVAVCDICKRLDGLPLAIELAAARIRILSPRALLDRLGRRFEILRDGSRDLPERQRTLFGAIAWSYRLLSPPQQRLLRNVSIFSDQWTFEAAAAVGYGDGDDPTSLYDELEILIDNNLLKPPREADGELHLGMLETIREFGRQRLQEAEEADAVRDRHVRYYVSYARQAQAELNGPSQEVWHRRIDGDLEDIRQAVNWALQRGQLESAARIVIGLSKFWDQHGHWRTALAWLEQVLMKDTLLPTDVASTAFAQAGWMACRLGDFERATRLLDESVARWRALGERTGLSRALDLRGVIAMYQDDYANAAACVEESLSLQRTAGDETLMYDSLTNLALIAFNRGENGDAAQLFLEALERGRGAGDLSAMAIILVNLGEVYDRMDAADLSKTSFDEAESILVRLGDRARAALITSHRGVAALKQGDYALASNLQSHAIRIWEDLDQKDYLIMAIERVAMIACARNMPESAARLLGASRELRRTLRLPPWPLDRYDYDRCLSRARSALEQSSFDAAWSAGTRLSLQDAVAASLQLTAVAS